MSEAAIRFDRVSKAFGPRQVLKEVSFSVPAGTAFVLLGRSGTGKSVTLKLICGLVEADSGAVVIEGADLRGLERKALFAMRRRIGFLFQSAALFDSLSVGENVAFPLRRHSAKTEAEIHEQAEGLLARVGLAGEFDHMPDVLSGGMRKRAGLARALAMEPGILLVDEPGAGLDPITAVEIEDLLLDLKQNHHVTLVMVTHSMPSARRIADTLAVLDGGVLLAEGSVAELEGSADPVVRCFMNSQQAG